MKHVPHLLIDRPWDGSSLSLSDEQWRHLGTVLRMASGEVVTYTDGRGTQGSGTLGEACIRRGEEEAVERPTRVTVVVAPPASRDRQRFLVEKLAELGVERLCWLETRHGKNRVAGEAKLRSWAVSATEQSRGAWLMEVESELIGLSDLEPGWVVCQAGGGRDRPRTTTIVIGPEGGFAEGELPGAAVRWDLGPTILRVETAALVAVAKLTT